MNLYVNNCFVLFQISDESESIQFIILVYVDEEEMGSAAAAPSRASKGSRTTEEEDLRVPGSASNGWVVMKTLKELQVCSLLRFCENRKILIGLNLF